MPYPRERERFDRLGAVEHPYYIGTYEVTNAQYAEFLNAVARADQLRLPVDQYRSTHSPAYPAAEFNVDLGFRLASIVPEPNTGVLVITGLLGLGGWRRAHA